VIFIINLEKEDIFNKNKMHTVVTEQDLLIINTIRQLIGFPILTLEQAQGMPNTQKHKERRIQMLMECQQNGILFK